MLDYQNDTEFMQAFDAIGIHYPCTAASEKGQGNALLAAGKKLWASEDWWSEAEWGGAACWAKLFSAHQIRTTPQPHSPPSPRSDLARSHRSHRPELYPCEPDLDNQLVHDLVSLSCRGRRRGQR